MVFQMFPLLLTHLGTQCFVAQMNVQKAEILERLSTARNFSNLEDDDNYSAASKAVRQVSLNIAIEMITHRLQCNYFEPKM